MKLITELNETINLVVEEKGGKKNHYIEGIFMQAEQKNRNGRFYPGEVLANEVRRYNEEYVEKKRAFGELGHPDGPTINLERASHMIVGLKEDGNNNFIGKAKVLDTPMGNIVKNLIDEGAQLGVSSRGMGSLKPAKNEDYQVVQDDFHLATAADIVADPSAPNAFVQGIMEGREWVFSSQSGWRAVDTSEQIREEFQKATVEEIEKEKLRAFGRFLTSIGNFDD